MLPPSYMLQTIAVALTTQLVDHLKEISGLTIYVLRHYMCSQLLPNNDEGSMCAKNALLYVQSSDVH